MRAVSWVRSVSWVRAISWVRSISRVRAVCWVRSWSKLWMRSSRSIHIRISIPGWMGMLSNVVTCTSMRHVRVVAMHDMVLLCVHIAKLVHVVLMIFIDRRVGSCVLSFETSLALFVLVIEQRLNVDILLCHFMDRVRLFSDFLSCFVLLHVPVFSMLMIGVVHIMLLLVVTMSRMLMVRSCLRHTVIQAMLFTISCLEPTSELGEVKRLALLLLLELSNGVCVGWSPSRVLFVDFTLLDILRLGLTREAAVRVLIRVLSVMALHLLLGKFLMMKSRSKLVLGNTFLPRHMVHLLMMDDLCQRLLVDRLLERQLVVEVLASLLGHDVVVIDGLRGLALMRHYWHTEGDTVRGDDTRRVERGPLPLDILLGRLVETLAAVMQRYGVSVPVMRAHTMLTLVKRCLVVGTWVVGHTSCVVSLLMDDGRVRAHVVLSHDCGVDIKVVMRMAQVRSCALLRRSVDGVLVMDGQTLRLRLRSLNLGSRAGLGRVLRLVLLLLVLRGLLRRSCLLLRRLG